MSNIHPTAIISSEAKIAASVKIGAYAVIEDDVEILDNTVIEPYAFIKSGSRIAEDCKICAFTVISGDPQDLHFSTSTKTFVNIGKGTTIRESTTIHRATIEGNATVIGENCLLMASSHVGHDSLIGDNVIIANSAAVGGFVKVGKDVFISGGVMLHQKLRVGQGVMISGNSAFSRDIPPYVNALERNMVKGLNLIGLSRRKVSRDCIANLKAVYMAVYGRSGGAISNARQALDSNLATCCEAEEFLRFFTEVEGRTFVFNQKD